MSVAVAAAHAWVTAEVAAVKWDAVAADRAEEAVDVVAGAAAGGADSATHSGLLENKP